MTVPVSAPEWKREMAVLVKTPVASNASVMPGPLLDHHRNGDRLDLVFHVLVAAGLRGHADDLDVLARAAVQRVEHAAEDLDAIVLCSRFPITGMRPDVLVAA